MTLKSLETITPSKNTPTPQPSRKFKKEMQSGTQFISRKSYQMIFSRDTQTFYTSVYLVKNIFGCINLVFVMITRLSFRPRHTKGMCGQYIGQLTEFTLTFEQLPNQSWDTRGISWSTYQKERSLSMASTIGSYM